LDEKEKEWRISFYMKNKIKRQRALLPALKERKRYIVYEVLSEGAIKLPDVQREIERSFSKLFGVTGAARAGLMHLNDWKKKRGITRVSHKYVDHLKSLFCFIEKVNNKNVIIRSVGVSGILKKARNNYMEGK